MVCLVGVCNVRTIVKVVLNTVFVNVQVRVAIITHTIGIAVLLHKAKSTWHRTHYSDDCLFRKTGCYIFNIFKTMSSGVAIISKSKFYIGTPMHTIRSTKIFSIHPAWQFLEILLKCFQNRTCRGLWKRGQLSQASPTPSLSLSTWSWL